MSPLPDVERDYRGELFRKGIHLSSLTIPVGYAFLDRPTVLAVLIPVTALFLLTDLARLASPGFRTWYHGLFGWLMRGHEKGEGTRSLNGASYVLISATLCIFLFPRSRLILEAVSRTYPNFGLRIFSCGPIISKSEVQTNNRGTMWLSDLK